MATRSTAFRANRVEEDEEDASMPSLVSHWGARNGVFTRVSGVVVSDDDEEEEEEEEEEAAEESYFSLDEEEEEEEKETVTSSSSLLQSPRRAERRVSDVPSSSASSQREAASTTAGPPRVEITGGTYKGSRGVYVRSTAQRTVVRLDQDVARERFLAPDNVRFVKETTVPPSELPRSSPSVASSRVRNSPTSVTQTNFYSPGDMVDIVGGTYRGKTATVVKQTEKRVSVQIANDVQVRHLSPSSLSPAVAVTRDPSREEPSSATTVSTSASGAVWNTGVRRSPRGHPASPVRYDAPPVETPPVEVRYHAVPYGNSFDPSAHPVSSVMNDGTTRELGMVVSDDEEDDEMYFSLDEEEEDDDDDDDESFTSASQNPTHGVHRVSDDFSSVEEADAAGPPHVVRQADHRDGGRLDDDAVEQCSEPSNVQFPQTPSTPSEVPLRSSPLTKNIPTSAAETNHFSPGDVVRIVGGSYRGQMATVVKLTEKRVSVQIENDVKVRHLRPSSLSAGDVSDDPLSEGPVHASRSTASLGGVLNTGLRRSPREHPSSIRGDMPPVETPPMELLHHIFGLREDSVELVAPGRFAQCQKTLAFAIFGHRVRTLHFSGSRVTSSIPISSTEPDGSRYELLSVKLQKPNSFESRRSRQIQAQYVLTHPARHLSDSIPTINVQEELDRFANFGRLTTGKVVARLELLQSTAYMHNQRPMICSDLTVDDLEEIPEVAHEGCGFMPASLVQHLFGKHAVGKRTFALQVRILAPKLGLFKGMLVVKPGIQRIQLPSSMRKVEASVAMEHSDSMHANKVFLLVNGKFPSDVNARHLPKLFRGDLPAKSFTPKVLSDMILRLWREWPIPDEIIDPYVEKSQMARGQGLEHTCLVGLADPTGGIPAGMVFITGIHCQQAPIQDTIFVTRYPCTESTTDGHILAVLRDRPWSMDEATWKWMNALHFGGIIFGNPASASEKPLPCGIANGDLDGDLYFVCWNEEIVSHCMAARSVGIPRTACTVEAAITTPVENPEWLLQGQEWMSDVQKLSNLSALIRQLYKHWKQQTGGRDSVHFGRAYKSALDIGKHGGFVFLPLHLWGVLPSSLHSLLTTTPN